MSQGQVAIARRRSLDAAVSTSLAVQDLELDVRLGCGAEERSVPQKVRLAFQVYFASPPDGCWTDHLGDTVCYAELSEIARAHCASREFHLVERLASELHELIRARLPEGARLDLEVTKVAPPIADLRGGVRFRIVES